MKQWKVKVELKRLINGEWETVKTDYVWAFDDECIDYNVWAESLEVFEKDMIDKDSVWYYTSHLNIVQLYNGEYIVRL